MTGPSLGTRPSDTALTAGLAVLGAALIYLARYLTRSTT